MADVQVLTIASLLKLFNLKGLYMFSYSWLLGMSFWVTFFGGVIAYRALPRQQFGALQHRTFPVYFVISISLSSGLLAAWTLAHPDIMTNYTSFRNPDVAQAYVLGTIAILQGFNQFWVGPLTSKTMFQRHKLEKEEGKAYNDEGVSDEMKALNRKFAQLHGWSSLANLYAFLAAAFHGLWIANYGLNQFSAPSSLIKHLS
ncbi:hypothetical protein SCHPADRAFT_897741 [Schizopora paradoxa]|uniref:TMEM205-like domain-containing protein n=1 Tax=Schizopora paradoxa TaxID=27342 RepID=A0A0H2S8B4_9AGAM|nr:hypothetical protein SCHPADRAFT_897741 [Schizopora paradoxa]